MWSNGNSFGVNGNSAHSIASDDVRVRTMPWLFRILVPGFQGGWPA